MNKRLPVSAFLFSISILAQADQHTCRECHHFKTEHHNESTQNSATKHNGTDNQPASHSYLSNNFGKTHFIIGKSATEIREAIKPGSSVTQNESPEPTAADDVRSIQAYFSPDDGLQKVLLDLIANEKTSIKIAIFLFTNGDIAQALCKAKNQGIAIEIVTDPSCLTDKFNKVELLAQAGIPVYIYTPAENSSIYGSRMHHKFILFGNNKDNKKLLWFGSFNLTKTADLYNQEAVIVCDNQQLVTKFNLQFDVLKKRCVSHKSKKKSSIDPADNAVLTAKNSKTAHKNLGRKRAQGRKQVVV